MNKNAELKVRKLTQNQAKVLEAIISSPAPNFVVSGTYISTASGLRENALGGTVSALERTGTIQPFGREGRQFNWELTDPDLIQIAKENKNELLRLIKRISGGS